MWHRVFCRSDDALSPSGLMRTLHAAELPVTAAFRGDDVGWTGGEIVLPQGGPVMVERYLTEADNLRADLNTWAAYVETLDYEPNHVMLMERIIQSKQLITIRLPIDRPNEVLMEKLGVEIARYVAANSDGIYQIEDVGWFTADGTRLLQEY